MRAASLLFATLLTLLFTPFALAQTGGGAGDRNDPPLPAFTNEWQDGCFTAAELLERGFALTEPQKPYQNVEQLDSDKKFWKEREGGPGFIRFQQTWVARGEEWVARYVRVVSDMGINPTPAVTACIRLFTSENRPDASN